MIVLGAKGEICVVLDQADDRVGCESWVRKLCAEGGAKKKVPFFSRKMTRTRKKLKVPKSPLVVSF